MNRIPVYAAIREKGFVCYRLAWVMSNYYIKGTNQYAYDVIKKLMKQNRITGDIELIPWVNDGFRFYGSDANIKKFENIVQFVEHLKSKYHEFYLHKRYYMENEAEITSLMVEPKIYHGVFEVLEILKKQLRGDVIIDLTKNYELMVPPLNELKKLGFKKGLYMLTDRKNFIKKLMNMSAKIVLWNVVIHTNTLRMEIFDGNIYLYPTNYRKLEGSLSSYPKKRKQKPGPMKGIKDYYV